MKFQLFMVNSQAHQYSGNPFETWKKKTKNELSSGDPKKPTDMKNRHFFSGMKYLAHILNIDMYSHPQIDGKVNPYWFDGDSLFHLFGDYYMYVLYSGIVISNYSLCLDLLFYSHFSICSCFKSVVYKLTSNNWHIYILTLQLTSSPELWSHDGHRNNAWCPIFSYVGEHNSHN